MSAWLLSPAAARDLESIVDHIALEQHEPEAAAKLVDEFLEAFDLLARAPHAGRIRTELTGEAVRWWVLHRYLIVYEPTEPLRILRVIHGARKIEMLFKP